MIPRFPGAFSGSPPLPNSNFFLRSPYSRAAGKMSSLLTKLLLRRLGARFSNVPKTFCARQAVLLTCFSKYKMIVKFDPKIIPFIRRYRGNCETLKRPRKVSGLSRKWPLAQQDSAVPNESYCRSLYVSCFQVTQANSKTFCRKGRVLVTEISLALTAENNNCRC